MVFQKISFDFKVVNSKFITCNIVVCQLLIQFKNTCYTGDYVPEHVGPPVACCQVKLVDVPDMEYYASGNQGEVCVRGTNVFVGYFKEPELTNNTIDDTNWHHTGDIGQWLPVNIFVTFYSSNV